MQIKTILKGWGYCSIVENFPSMCKALGSIPTITHTGTHRHRHRHTHTWAYTGTQAYTQTQAHTDTGTHYCTGIPSHPNKNG
jgi:hypothetical protein